MMSSVDRCPNHMGILSGIPFATLAAASCYWIGSWHLFGELRLMLVGHTTVLSNGASLESRVGSWVFCTASLMICLEVLTVLIGFASTGPTRHIFFKNLKARAAGRLFCSVLIIIHFVLLICLFDINITLYKTWDSKTGKLDILRLEDRCVKLDIMVNGSWATDEWCHLSDDEMARARVSLTAVEKLWLGAMVNIPLVLCGQILSLMCLAANYVRIKDHDQVPECACRREGDSNDGTRQLLKVA